MANGNQSRRDGNREGKRTSLHLASSNLGEMIEQAPGATEFVTHVRHHPDHPKPLTDPMEIQEACLEILERRRGSADKVYEIFGGKFQWEMHDFAVLRFLGTLDDGTFDVPGRKFDVGFFIPVNKLLASADHLMHTPNHKVRDWNELAPWEQFVVLLQSNPEMILAKEQFLDNQQRARQAQAAEVAEAGKAKLENVLSKIGGKVEPLKLKNIAGILKARFATFDVVDTIDDIESRVTLHVCKSHKTDGIIIRFKAASSGHPMEEMAAQSMFVWQGDMVEFDSEDGSVLEGKALLARQAREWLRIKLREAGAIPPATPKLTVVGAPMATPDTVLQDALNEDSYPGNVDGSEAKSATS